MAAGLAQRLTRHDDPWHRHDAIFDGDLDPEIGAAYVAHGREPAHQHLVHDADRACHDETVVYHLRTLPAAPGDDQVPLSSRETRLDGGPSR